MTDAGLTEEQFDGENYSIKVGERLRLVRRQKRMSLQEVEAESGHEFKASVLGAYERGERAISAGGVAVVVLLFPGSISQLIFVRSVGGFRQCRAQ